jgi:hypothetical protein
MNEGKLKASMWHIAENRGLLGHGDERLIVVGETLTVAGPIFMCGHGLHACARLLDALAYANGTVICEVILGADAYTEDDKSVSSSRTCIAMTTPEVGERILRNFARWCALDVAHLWDMPKDVRQYLETGDESVRSAAETAAWTAARAAAEAAAEAAARAAARAAAWTAQRLRHVLRHGLRHVLRQRLRHVLRQGLRHGLRQRLRHVLRHGLRHVLRQRLRHVLRHGLRHGLRQRLR